MSSFSSLPSPSNASSDIKAIWLFFRSRMRRLGINEKVGLVNDPIEFVERSKFFIKTEQTVTIYRLIHATRRTKIKHSSCLNGRGTPQQETFCLWLAESHVSATFSQEIWLTEISWNHLKGPKFYRITPNIWEFHLRSSESSQIIKFS